MIEFLKNTVVPPSTTPLVEVVSQTGNVVNISNDLLVCGHKYIKTGFSPITMDFKFINAPYDMLYLKKSIYLSTVGLGQSSCIPLYKNVVRRNADGGYRYLTDTRDYSEIGATPVRSVDNTTMSYNEIIWSSTLFDIVIGTVKATANARYLYIINNVDATAQTAIDSTTYSDYVYLSEDASFIYILATRQNGIMGVVSINKVTKVAAVTTTSGSTSLVTGPLATHYVKHKVIDFMVQDDGTYKWSLLYLVGTTMTCRVVTYNPSAVGTDAIAKMGVMDYTLVGTIPSTITAIHSLVYKAIDKNTVAVYYGVFGTGTVIGATPYSSFGVMTISFDHVNKIATMGTLTQATEVAPIAPMWDGVNTLYVVSKIGFSKLVYDTNNKKYVKLAEVVCSPVSIGLDNSGIIYVWDTNNNLRQFTPFAIKRLSVTCPVKGTIYQGVDIDVNCYTSVYNYEGNRMATSVRLTIYGDGVFKANGLKVITVTSSVSDEVSTTVTITGPTTMSVVGEASGSVSG